MVDSRWASAVHVLLRPVFALALAASQFTSQRGAFFTSNSYALVTGAIITVLGLWLWRSASISLVAAQRAGALARTGPYGNIRHPIYVSIYVLSMGMGLVFFAWAWFAVLVAFVPFWWLECRREEVALADVHGDAFEAYCQRTSMFIPGIV